MNRSILLIIVLFCAIRLSAQTEATDTVALPVYSTDTAHVGRVYIAPTGDAGEVKKPDAPFLRLLYKLQAFLRNMSMNGVDTAYIAMPKYDWRLAAVAEVGQSYGFIQGENFTVIGNPFITTFSPLNVRVGGVISYQNIMAMYAHDVTGKDTKQFTFDFMQNGWGFNIRWYRNNSMLGNMRIPEIDGILPYKSVFDPGSTQVSKFYLSAYYVFSRDKYSLPAAFNQSYIQRKSAGSAFLMANFMTYKMTTSNLDVNEFSLFKEMDLFQAAIGVGYGYNYTPNNGKVLLHISAAPMLVVYSNATLSSPATITVNDSVSVKMDVMRRMKPNIPVNVAGTARAAVVYHITDRMVLAATVSAWSMRFHSDKNLLKPLDVSEYVWHSNASMLVNTVDWYASLIFGVRFEFLPKRHDLEQRYKNVTIGDLFDFKELNNP